MDEIKYDVDNYSEVFELGSTEHYRIGPDKDGLGCVEISYFDHNKTKYNQLTLLPPEMAILVGKELIKHAEILINKEKNAKH